MLALVILIVIYGNYTFGQQEIINEDVGQDGSSGMLGDSQPGSGSGMIGDETQYSTISSGENADTDKNENGVSSTNHDDQTVVNKKYKITINSLHPFTNTDLVKRNNIKKVVISRGLGQKKMWYMHHPYYAWLSHQRLYRPVKYRVPAGKCLPENSLCDVGHDDQCCGHATFCVDYWGVGKCLAFIKPSYYDMHDAYRIARNKNYKAYYNNWLYTATYG